MAARIAVDFDGTLCDFAWPGVGAVKPGAKEALTFFQKLGLHIVIYSCRTSQWDYDIFGGDPNQPTMERDCVRDMVRFLKDNAIPYDEIDDGSRGKPNAILYIDDKGITFDNNWNQIASFVGDIIGKRKVG